MWGFKPRGTGRVHVEFTPVPHEPAATEAGQLRERIGRAELVLVSFLAGQTGLADPDDRNLEAIDLAIDVARVLGVRLPGSPPVPVIPGRSS